MANLAGIDLKGLDPRLQLAEILVACDVDNPLCGINGATAVYGPQKGATPDMLAELDEALRNYADIAGIATGRDVAERPGCGGGRRSWRGGLMFFTNAVLKPGVEIVLAAVGFDDIVKNADLVITGEGSTDFQTANGKAPVGVARIAQKYNVPTVCLSGGLGEGYEEVYKHGIAGVMSIIPKPMGLAECMADAPELIKSATARLCHLISIGLSSAKRPV